MFTDTQRLDFFEEHSTEFRYSSGISMDGSRPCWYIWLRAEGRTRRKTLRESIDAVMEDYIKCEEWSLK